MNIDILTKTVSRLVASPKGILAIDESLGTCKGRFDKLGVPFTEENRRLYREMLVTAPGIEEYISGYILVEETAFQKTGEGVLFAEVLKQKGICMGVTSNTGYSLFDTVDGVKQEITEGLSDLASRMKRYKEQGAVFSKWRDMVRIGEHAPTEEFLREGAKRLAEYATICQENDIVPIVEPEVLIDGNHTIEKCYQVTARNLDIVFDELKKRGVYIPGIILKTSMVMPGNETKVAVDDLHIAKETIKCLKEKVPADIGGIVFLSGGQGDVDATLRLNEMHRSFGTLPWALTFSYGRAIQNLALQSWAKNPEDVAGAQTLLVIAAKANSLASIGEYK